MKPLSHFQNFACPAALDRRVSCHQDIRSFTLLMINATALQHLPTALPVDSFTSPRRPTPCLAHMQFP